MMSWVKRATLTGGAAILAGGMALAQSQQPASAIPGTINYTEGRVSIDGRAVARGQNASVVEPGQVLRTDQGKAEMLLTPGVFLRLGDQTAVKMVSPSITDTRVQLLQGEAMVEADQVLDGNHLVVDENGVDSAILKHGLYRFTTNPAEVSVYDGKAQVFIDDRAVDVGKGKELALAPSAALKPQSFDRKAGDPLYEWSSVRSQYVAEANQSSVQYIVDAGYPYGSGLGWYWNPWFSSWAFVPGTGYWGSPFGWGFYSPTYWRAYAPARYYVRPGVVGVGRIGGGFRGGFGGGFHGGGFHGGGFMAADSTADTANLFPQPAAVEPRDPDPDARLFTLTGGLWQDSPMTFTQWIAASAFLLATAPLPAADDANRQLARDLLKQLIEINTTDSSGSTTAAAQAMAKRLLDAGFPAADVKVLGPNDRKGNLVVRIHGTSTTRKPVLIICHLDVVEARRADWTTDPFEFVEKDGYFYGRGTQDVKENDAALIADLIRLHREGWRPDRDLIVALTADEEGGQANGVDWLLKNHRDLIDAEFALNPDGGGVTSVKGKIINVDVEASEKLYADFEFSSTNPGGHSSLPVPDNAIYHLANAIAKVEKTLFPLELNEVTRTYFTRARTAGERRDEGRHERPAARAARSAGGVAAVEGSALQLAAPHHLRCHHDQRRPRHQCAAATGEGQHQLPHSARPFAGRDPQHAGVDRQRPQGEGSLRQQRRRAGGSRARHQVVFAGDAESPKFSSRWSAWPPRCGRARR